MFMSWVVCVKGVNDNVNVQSRCYSPQVANQAHMEIIGNDINHIQFCNYLFSYLMLHISKSIAVLELNIENDISSQTIDQRPEC